MEWKIMADLRAEVPEISVPQIAQRVGRSPASIRVWIRQPKYQAYENWVFTQKKAEWTPYERAHRADVGEMIQEFSGEMASRLLEIAESTDDEKLQAAIAQDWLDRGGYAAQKKTTGSAQIVLTEGAVAEIFRRMQESQGVVTVGSGRTEGVNKQAQLLGVSESE
jgi:hypothetical protein